MTPAELQAIRARDVAVREDTVTSRDRRALLAYVDELEAKVTEQAEALKKAGEIIHTLRNGPLVMR